MKSRQDIGNKPDNSTPHYSWKRFFGGFVLLIIAGYVVLNTPAVNSFLVTPVNESLAMLAGLLIQVSGGQVSQHGNVLSIPSFAVEIVDMCNGVEASLLLCAAILAFSAPWLYKLKGIIVGLAAIYILNILRIINLLYLGAFDRDLFEIVHWYLWDIVLILYIFLLFALWIRFHPERKKPVPGE